MININIFFVYSIIGFIYESIVNLIQMGSFESGFMYGPWTPIYGISVLIILFINKKVSIRCNNKITKLFLVALISFVTLTIIEYLSGNLLQILFKKVYWNYSGLRFSFGKYIALEVSLIWAIMSIIIVIIHPKIEKYIKKIPKYLSYILIFSFAIDLIMSLIKLL